MSRSGNLAAELVCEEESTARLFVNALQIATVPDGYNSGRSYYLQAGSSQLKQEVSSQLQSLVYAARKKAEVQTHFGQAQASVRRVYVSKPFQYGAALLITAVREPVPRLRRRFRIAATDARRRRRRLAELRGEPAVCVCVCARARARVCMCVRVRVCVYYMQNFVVNLLESQFVNQLSDGAGRQTALGRGMDAANDAFTAVFTAELLVNLFAHWLRPFLANPWSLLDAFIVLMSLVALGHANIPVTVLRLMRAFRVVRLFGRLHALRKIITALSASIVPMMNAFLILFIIASICEPAPRPRRNRGAEAVRLPFGADRLAEERVSACALPAGDGRPSRRKGGPKRPLGTAVGAGARPRPERTRACKERKGFPAHRTDPICVSTRAKRRGVGRW